MEAWERALEEFIDPWRRKSCVVGALVCGSYVTGSPSKHSDIDVQIILAEGTAWRERGNRIVDGFLIEYFANPPAQMPGYFREDHSDNAAMAATMFATGRILFDKEGVLPDLRREARKWLRKRHAKPGKTWLKLNGYGLWDRLDNLQDAHERQAPDFAYVYHDALNAIYAAYAKLLGQPILHPHQQYRVLTDPETARRKYLIEPFPDQQFLDLFMPAMAEADADRMLRYAEELTAYVQEKMGGFEIDGWKFRSPAEG